MILRRTCAAALAALMVSGCMLTATGCSQAATNDGAGSGDAPQAEAPATRTVADSNGNEVEIPYEVTRVAPTMGAFAQVTEMLCNGNGKIVAASSKQISDDFKAVFADYEQSNPNGYDSSSVEDLIAAGTQVVYGPGSMYSDEQKAQLQEAGIALVELNKLGTVADMCDNFLTIGEILGPDEYEAAQEFVAYYQKSISDAEDRAKGLQDSEKKTVLQMNISGGAYICADDSDISAAYYDAVGAKNVAAGYEGAQSGQYRTVDAEQIVAWNPEYIITMNTGVKDQIMADAALADVTAVKNGDVYVCPTALYLWCVRSAEGALMTPWLGTVIYPDLYQDVDMVQVLQGFYADFYGASLSDADAQAILSGATSNGSGAPSGQGGGRG